MSSIRLTFNATFTTTPTMQADEVFRPHLAKLLKDALRNKVERFGFECDDVQIIGMSTSIPATPNAGATDADVGTDAPDASPCEPRAPRGIVARAISAGHGRETNH